MYKIVQTAYFPIDSHKHSLIYNNLSFNISKLFLSFCKLSLFNSGVREPENIGSDRVYFFFSLKIWNKTLHPSIANLNVIFPPCSIFRNFRIFSGNPSRSRWSRVPGDFRILARLSTVDDVQRYRTIWYTNRLSIPILASSSTIQSTTTRAAETKQADTQQVRGQRATLVIRMSCPDDPDEL